MKNIFFLSLLMAATHFVAVSAAPMSDAAEKFQKTIEQVDMNGEMLRYQNTKGIQKFLTTFVPQILKLSLKDNPLAPTIVQGWDSFCQLINPEAFEAFASSSKEIGNDLYLFKSFILFDRQKKSILFEQNVENSLPGWQNFPADTIIAVKGKINFKHVWDTILEQLKKSPEQTAQALLLQIEMLKQSGIDIGKTVSGINGNIELIVAGTSTDDLAVKFEFPDKSGELSAFIVPLAEELEIPIGDLQLKSAIVPGKIIFYTDKRLLDPPKAKLGNSAIFRKFAAHLPEKGNMTVVLNISKELTDQLKQTKISGGEDFSEFFKLLKPVALLGIQSAETNGEKGVIASNFSIPQVQQVFSVLTPAAATILPSLNSARENAKSAQCVNGMKQFALACHLFADSDGTALPPSADKLIERKLLNADISANIIYLAPGVKLSEIINPSAYPLAICSRFNHKSDKVCIAFADGHVETIPVPENSDEKEIIGILSEKYQYPQEVQNALLKAVEQGK